MQDSSHFHIERLVLDGLPLPAQARFELAAALQDELGRLLSQGELDAFQTGLALPRLAVSAELPASPLAAAGPAGFLPPVELGRQIAHALYNGLVAAPSSAAEPAPASSSTRLASPLPASSPVTGGPA
jgi:hypothetical protein